MQLLHKSDAARATKGQDREKKPLKAALFLTLLFLGGENEATNHQCNARKLEHADTFIKEKESLSFYEEEKLLDVLYYTKLLASHIQLWQYHSLY